MQEIPLAAIKHDAPSYNLIQEHISLADKNWFGTGGHARFYAEPATYADLQNALSYAINHNLALFVLGSGANILISDDGFDGLVIKPAFKTMNIVDETVTSALVQADAGVSFHDLIMFCLDHQLVGLEEFAGIPGTVGGSMYINIHYFEFLLSQFLVAAEIVDRHTGVLSHVEPSWFNFGYNQSTLQHKDHVLVTATFQLRKATPLESAFARGRCHEIIRHRQRRYPYKGTCGSFFRNFFDHEVSLTTAHGKPLIYVAYYLDMLGIKGTLSAGNALVSHQHANMLVNTGTASSSDIITLARLMQEKVYDHFSILPQPECQLIGFTSYPLLKA